MARTIVLPFLDLPAIGLVPVRLDHRLENEQGEALRNLCDALVNEGAMLTNGRRIRNYADCVRYLLEQVRAAPDDEELAAVAQAWPQLTPETRAHIVALAGQH